METRAIRECDLIASGDDESTADIDRRIRPEHDSVRIEKVKIRVRYGRTQQAINGRSAAASDARQNVLHVSRPGKCGRLTGRDVELTKAMKQIVAAKFSEGRRHGKIRSGQCDSCAE